MTYKPNEEPKNWEVRKAEAFEAFKRLGVVTPNQHFKIQNLILDKKHLAVIYNLLLPTTRQDPDVCKTDELQRLRAENKRLKADTQYLIDTYVPDGTESISLFGGLKKDAREKELI